MRRKDVPIPDGWKVRPNSHVQVLDHAKLAPADLAIPGEWRALERSPDGWWIYPANQAAHRWLAANAQRAGAQSGCVQVHAQRLVPGWLQLTARPA